MAKNFVFTVAIGGYEKAFSKAVESQKRYAEKNGYEYCCFVGEHNASLQREVAWLKVPLLLGALAAGYQGVFFIDSDAAIAPECPPFHSLFSEDNNDIFLANGHSGRANSGVIIVRNTLPARHVLERILSSAGLALPSQSSVGWGENGYFIHHLNDYKGFRLLPETWNNTSKPDPGSFVLHYTGPMRAHYLFNEQEAAAWQEIQGRRRVSGEGSLTDRFEFFSTLAQIFNQVAPQCPSYGRFDFGWCRLASARPEALVDQRVHVCVDMRPEDPDNPYVMELIRGMTEAEPRVAVETGVERFWTRSYSNVDILHIQWAEVLCDWRKPSPEHLARLHERLAEISLTTRIIFTVHNIELKADFDEMRERLLDVVARFTSVFVHLSQASVAAFAARYSKYGWVLDRPHAVIGHGDYDFYRRLPQQSFTPALSRPKRSVLVFGALRSADELALTLDVAERCAKHDVTFTIAGPVPNEILHWKEQKRLEKALDGPIRRVHRRIPSNQICSLLDLADVLFLPRAGRLNSGVLFLSYTFMKPVVAPRSLSMAEAQSAVGGATYESGDAADAERAVRAALDATAEERVALQARMFRFKYSAMSWSGIGHQHVAAYRAALEAGPRGIAPAILTLRKSA